MITETMQPATSTMPRYAAAPSGSLASWGALAVNYSLAVIFLWFGCLKFTDYEASGVAPLIMNSPLVMWLHGAVGIAGASYVIGVFEIAAGLLIAMRPWQPRLSAIGGAMGVLTFLVTLSFMFSTPGVVQPDGGSPLALSAMPGQFLLKDLVLLAVSLWIMGASLSESDIRR